MGRSDKSQKSKKGQKSQKPHRKINLRSKLTKTVWTVIDGLLTLATLALALFEFNDVTGQDQPLSMFESWVLLTLLFSTMLITSLVRAFQAGRRNRTVFIRHLIYVGSMLIAVAFVLIVRDVAIALTVLSWLYIVPLLASRVLSIIGNHKIKNVIPNIVLIVLIVLLTADPMMIMLLIIAQGLTHIIGIAFASVDVKVLKKIIRKTYATEILFGFILLIFGFSLVLPLFEPQIKNTKDALWYCFATVTTIGYGDLSAVTSAGRIMSVVLGLYGIVVVALITSIIVNFYGEMRKDDRGPAEQNEQKQLSSEDTQNKEEDENESESEKTED